jgi:hypothetical protein
VRPEPELNLKLELKFQLEKFVEEYSAVQLY